MQLKRMLASAMTGFMLLTLTGVAGAGQVVTPEVSSWAKKVLQDEKSLQAQELKNSLMVLYYKNISRDPAFDPLQKGLTLMLITDLSNVPGLQVLERVKLQALMEEMGLGASGLTTPNTAPRAGKLAGAQWVVGGDIKSPKPSDLQLDSRFIEVQSANVLAQHVQDGTLEKLLALEKKLVFEIVALTKIQVTPEINETLRKPASTSMPALVSLFNAVDASDKGDYKKAADLYADALDKDPNIIVAQDAINEMKSLGLLGGWNRSHGGPPLVQQRAKSSEKAATTAKSEPPAKKDPKDEASKDDGDKTGDLLATVTNATSQSGTLAPKDTNQIVPPAIQSKISTKSVNVNVNFK